MELKKLQDYNEEQTKEWEKNNPYQTPKTRWNGIECPRCKGELADKNMCRIPTSPPTIKVYCPTCRFDGTRIALTNPNQE